MSENHELGSILEVLESCRLELFAIKDRIQALSSDLKDVAEAIEIYLKKGR